jgi:serine/threonine-protein kinase
MTHPPTEGNERLGDRYEVGGLLGRGGMADVRVGRDTRLGRTVAIKRLRSDLASDTTFQARFRREAQSSAKLNHPSIVAVYDTGEAIDRDGTPVPFIVMEHVEGRTLRDILREEHKILPQRALEITSDILDALDYSHRQGIVHRDIKPGNVMLTPAGQVKVMDFGIARAIADASSAMTQTAAVVGTAQYLSPEQARGEQVDARSDIYSTGCLMYELLTGRPPFVGDSPVSVAYQHVREEADRPSQHNPDLDDDVDAIVAKALAKRTDERYQSAAQMRADIERYLAGQQVAAPAVVDGPAHTTVAPAILPGDTGMFATMYNDEEPQRTGHRTLWSVLLVLVVAAIVAALVLIYQPFASDDPEEVAEVSVPRVTGEQVQRATDTLEASGFDVDTRFTDSDDIRKGQVISQDPPGGEFAEEGSTVTLQVSAGEETITVPPNLEGLQLSEARNALDAQGFEFIEVERIESTEPRNTVLTVTPGSGNEVEPDTTIVLQVSKGPILVPSVVGFTEKEAVDTLEAEGFTVDTDDEFSDEVPEGLVIDQSPTGDSEASTGDLVTVVISQGPEPTETTPPPTETEPTDDPPNDDETPGDDPPTDDETPGDDPPTDIQTEPGPDG